MFDYMAKKMDPKYANFEMDVFWVKHPGQDPVALLKKYKGRFPLMHLKDRRPGTEGNQNGRADDDTNVVLGAGDVGIGEIMKVAKKYGVKTDGNLSAATAEVLAALAALIEKGRLEIPIAHVYRLDQVRDAFAELEKRRTHGKIVLVP